MIIRKMTRSDITGITDLEKRAFSVGPYDYNMLKISYKLAKGMSLVALESHAVLGYAIAIGIDEEDADVESIAVDPLYQGRGVGKQLLLALEDLMRSRGYIRSVLEVREKNVSAISMYRKNGYVISEFIENYYEESFEGSRNAFRMIKNLLS
ncbi:MAG: GNAT family N-acetyltransferase [Candidatus Thermoplasmatota archaeon]|nr:GNAT family N-acetyltransferase [Candidatus Thermoplasmatota archaeon]MCL5790668.1 GNAT family N-acetyltransferase [Candidatus Thermoplasmatota archaeon]